MLGRLLAKYWKSASISFVNVLTFLCDLTFSETIMLLLFDAILSSTPTYKAPACVQELTAAAKSPGTLSTTSIARRFHFFGSGSVLGSCFRVKNLPRFLHRFLEPVLEPSSVRFSVFYEESRFVLGIPDFC